MLERKDYILRQIDEIGKLLKTLLNLPIKNSKKEIKHVFEESLIILDVDLRSFQESELDTILSKLSNQRLSAPFLQILSAYLSTHDDPLMEKLKIELIKQKEKSKTFYFTDFEEQ